MFTHKQKGRHNLRRPLYYKKDEDMSPCPPTDLVHWLRNSQFWQNSITTHFWLLAMKVVTHPQ